MHNHLEVVLPPGNERDDPALTTAAHNVSDSAAATRVRRGGSGAASQEPTEACMWRRNSHAARR